MTAMTEKQIAAYEAKGFKRWTKGKMDRLYIDATKLGAKIDYYKTGNVSDAFWQGERVSNSDGRRLLASKIFVDITTGELHVSTGFDEPYDTKSLEDSAKDLIGEIERELAEEEDEKASEVEIVHYDEDDPELLLTAAQEDLHNHTRPQVSYDASVLQFAEAAWTSEDEKASEVEEVEYAALLSAMEKAYDAIADLKSFGMDQVFRQKVKAMDDELSTWVHGLRKLKLQGKTGYVTRKEVEEAAKFDVDEWWANTACAVFDSSKG